MPEPKKQRNFWRRFARIVIKAILFIILFFFLIVILIQTGPVQNFIRQKAVAYLEKKLHTKVAVGRLYVGLPKNIILENIYIEDLKQDTLLYGGKVKVNLNLLRLIFNKEIDFKSIELDNITTKIKRELPDTAFNFQFIIDAFGPAGSSPTDPADSTSSAIEVRSVKLNNSRIVYNDVVTGNDIVVWVDHFDTRFDTFDPEHLNFDIPETNMNGVVASIYQVKPLATSDAKMNNITEATPAPPFSLNFKKANFTDFKLDYRNDVSATYALFDLGDINVTSNKLDLNNRIIDLKDVSLNNTNSTIRFGKNEEVKIVAKEGKKEAQNQAESDWRIKVASINLNNNNLQFDDDNSAHLKSGMDYSHLATEGLTLQMNDLLFTSDSIAGKISKGSFKEHSGFILNELKTDFLYSNDEAYLKDLYIKTPGTELQRSAVLHYASIEAMQQDIGNMNIELDLQDSKLLVKDLLTFVPALRQQPAFADPNTTWFLNSRISGKVSDLHIASLQVSGLKDTRIDASGTITGLPKMKNLYANLSIKNITSSRRDISLFIPKNSLPTNVTLPGYLSLKGTINGNQTNMTADLALTTDMGDATINGVFRNISDIQYASYDASVNTRSLQIGIIIQNPEAGPLSTTFTVKGTGLDPKTANAEFNGIVHSAVVKNYTYTNATINGNIAKQKISMDAGMTDPNIHFALNAVADVSAEYPAIKISGRVDSVKFQQLHLTSDAMIYRGMITADFPVTNPDKLEGKLFLTQSLLVLNDQRLQLDTVQLLAGSNDTGRFITLNSDIMNAQLTGQYKLTELGNIFQQAIQPYFAVVLVKNVVTHEPYNFTFNAYILDNPALKIFIPGLQRMDSVKLESHFSDKNGWTAKLNAPAIDMGLNKIRNLNLQAGTNKNVLDVTATLQKFTSGSSIVVDNSTLTARIADNKIDFTVNIKDQRSKEKYNISGLFEQPVNGNYQFTIKPDSLLLNYDAWNVSANNKISITKKGLNANQLVLSKNGQQLTVTSLSSVPNAPMEASFVNFKLSTLTGFVQSDSTLVNGTMNGKITFTELANEPVFIGDLSINDLSIKTDTVGNMHLLINNKTPNVYATNITLDGRGNDAKLTGNYYVQQVNNNNFDFDLNINKMEMASAQAFSNGAIRYATGSVNGNFSVKGNITKPVVNGDLNFNKTGFNLSMLNSFFKIDQEKISVHNDGIRFDHFEIRDSLQNSLMIDGLAATSDFSNYKFDLKIKANNFQALNSTKKDNRSFYGQLYFTTNLDVSGTDVLPVINGRLVVNEKTKMMVVIPQSEPGVAAREGIVEFIDMDAPLNDSLFRTAFDSLNTSALTGFDISVNIEVNKEAEFSLVIDEGTGDFLNVKGEALLNAGIDPSGKVTLTGSYELEKGSYNLTFNFLHRKFEIQKGSKIVWEGEPTSATVDIQAKYIANAAPLDLVKNQIGEVVGNERNTYLQKLPFDVTLKMEGELLKPQISFDIVLPENKNYAVSNDIIVNVRTRLLQLRQEEGEMNKQVFSLLFLNRFVTENPFNSSGNGPTISTIARQSVSKLLTEQLNRLADDLVAGVDLNFDVLSSEDYTTGQRRDRTDLNVGLSKKLLNDKITVTIGSNFELEGPQNSSNRGSNIAGNVAIDYQLSRDNRYLLRAYRKNEYQGIIEGYVIETGVGFIITLDYNKFSQIFKKRRSRTHQGSDNNDPANNSQPQKPEASQKESENE